MQIKLPEEMSIYTAEETLANLNDLTFTDQLVELDGSSVEYIDGCGLQILLSFLETLKQRNMELKIVKPGDSLTFLLELCKINL